MKNRPGLKITKYACTLVCWMLIALGNASAQNGQVYRTGSFELWLPDGVDTIKGLVSCVNFYSGAQLFDDTKLRAVAARTKLGLYRFPTGAVQDGKNLAMDSLTPLASLSGHPEIRYACLIPHGLSAAAWDAGGLVLRFPSRMIAYIPEAGFESQITGRAECRAIPVCGNNKGEDGFYPGSGVNTKDNIESGRQQLAPWSFQISLGCGHDSWCKMDWIYVWIEEICKVRLPANIPLNASPALLPTTETAGWLGKLYAKDNASGGSHWAVDSARVWNYASCPFDPKTCYWFPSQRAAEAWQYYMTHNSTLPATVSAQPRKVVDLLPAVRLQQVNDQSAHPCVQIHIPGTFRADLLALSGKKIGSVTGHDEAVLKAEGPSLGSGLFLVRIIQKGSVVNVKPVKLN